MVDAKAVGNTISVCRREKGFTQDELSVRLAVTPQAISRWERGNSLPDIDFLPDISRILDISVDDLLAGNLPRGGTFKKEQNPVEPESENSVMNYLLPDEMLILISFHLFEINGDSCREMCDLLIKEIVELRKLLAKEDGVILPTVRIRDDNSIKKDEYQILFKNKPMFTGKLPNAENTSENKDFPIPQDGADAITAEFKRLIKQNPAAVITRQMVKAIVTNAAIKNPVLIDEMIPIKINHGRLRLILIEILKANKPIKDMITILETIDEIGASEDIKMLSSLIAERL